jgi:hypothetical protein
MSNTDQESRAPLGERTVLIHKKDAEGALIVNAMTGIIQQDQNDRPEWAEGLSTALLSERLQFYTTRLGPHFTDELRNPDVLAFEDLGFIGVDEEGEPIELEADAEHRMETISTVFGIDRERNEDGVGTHTGYTVSEVEIGMQSTRSQEEQAAFERAAEQGFERQTGTR